MIVQLLLLVFFILLTLIFFGITIYFITKKRKKNAIFSLSVFVICTLATVFCTYTYLKNSINYVVSDEFQSTVKNKAEGMGKTYGNTVSGVSKGLNETLDDEEIAKLANKGAVITGKVIKAADGGLRSTLGETRILTDKSISDAGIEIGKATKDVGSSENTIGLYLDFKTDFKGSLRLISYDQNGNKTDSADMIINEKAGVEKIIVFQFEYAPPKLNGYCVLKKIE